MRWTWLAAVAILLATVPAIAGPLDGILIAPESQAETYDRDLYRHWTDDDGDGQDARQEALIAESLVPVQLAPDGTVTIGLWVGPYCGFVTTRPGDLDVDHMVPLKEAHVSGGFAWDAAKRQAFANALANPGHLIAVKAGCNRSKGDKDPAQWMPPNRAYWCTYLADWITVKREWSLSMDEAEAGAVTEGLRVCARYTSGDSLVGRH